jgi:hypothetical protein
MKKSKAFLLVSAGAVISALAYKVVKSKRAGVSEHELCKYKVEPSKSESDDSSCSNDISEEIGSTLENDVDIADSVKGLSLSEVNPALLREVDEAIKDVVGDELYAKVVSARESRNNCCREDELDAEVVARSVMKSAGIKPSDESPDSNDSVHTYESDSSIVSRGRNRLKAGRR